MTTETMSMDETLSHRNETAQELEYCFRDGTTDGPSFRALVRRLERLNKHLSDLGFNGTN